MKKLKRILTMMLVVCMIFTSQAFVTFAEGMKNTEAIVNETRNGSDLVGASEDNVGGGGRSLASPKIL